MVVIICSGWLLFCAYVYSNTGNYKFANLLTTFLIASWVIVWAIRLKFYLYSRSKYSSVEPLPAIRFGYWLAEPVALLLGMALIASGFFRYARFYLSKRELSQYVQGVQTGSVKTDYEFYHEPRKVGLYTVTITDKLPDGTIRFVTAYDGLDKSGFAYCPTSPPIREKNTYKHLKGPWWFWHQNF